MPSYKDVFPDKWLKAEHLGKARPTVAIQGVQVEKLHNPKTNKPEPRLVVEFHGKQLRLILNKTQAQALATVTGTEDYTRWTGHQIVIHAGIAPNGKSTIVISPVPDAPTPATPPVTNGEPARAEQNRAAIAVGVAMGQGADDDPFDEEPSIHAGM